MTAESKKPSATAQFGLTLSQKILSAVVLLIVSLLVVPLGPIFNGAGGSIIFVFFGLLLGVVTWYVSSAWSFKLELTNNSLKVRDGGRESIVPLEKLGLIARNRGWFPVPSVWLVMRGAEGGREIPAKGVDPKTRELIDAFQKRNPGKKITYVPLPGGYLRSVSQFVAELKGRIPPLTIDERLGGK